MYSFFLWKSSGFLRGLLPWASCQLNDLCVVDAWTEACACYLCVLLYITKDSASSFLSHLGRTFTKGIVSAVLSCHHLYTVFLTVDWRAPEGYVSMSSLMQINVSWLHVSRFLLLQGMIDISRWFLLGTTNLKCLFINQSITKPHLQTHFIVCTVGV